MIDALNSIERPIDTHRTQLRNEERELSALQSVMPERRNFIFELEYIRDAMREEAKPPLDPQSDTGEG